ncbi:Small ubiquitin-related modifier 1 [Astathelohania contejeani]|uniref:Small ubiquitin-related modifier 1 n=1 Tax=Astathelohania contejeani TaxID=164912 RepID=A0ABQ7HZL3_9MICR|nr:Small ubiquitin-related modifier 1 [Thelohania contejeani]
MEEEKNQIIPVVNKEKSNHIKLKVQDGDGREIEFRVKRSITLSKLLNAYCKNNNKDSSQLRLSYRGKFLSLNATPESIGLEDGELLEIMSSQVGGCNNFEI